MIKLLRFDNFFPSLADDIFAKTGSGMTTAIMFSRQNDAGCTCTVLSINLENVGNLVLVVEVVLESYKQIEK